MAGLTDRAWRLINRNAFTWRWLSNFGPTLAWRRSRPDLPPEGARVLADLRRDGLARTSVDALGFRAGIWEELQSAIAAEESRQAAQIEEARQAPEREGHKSYLIELLGRSPVLDPESVFVRIALDPAVLDIATSYFGMYVRLWQFNVWHNVPTRAAPRNSQLWHRDPEDRQILRIFIYLDDVGPGSGPLSYIPGSHALGAGRSGRRPRWRVRRCGRRTTRWSAWCRDPTGRRRRVAKGTSGSWIRADTTRAGTSRKKTAWPTTPCGCPRPAATGPNISRARARCTGRRIRSSRSRSGREAGRAGSLRAPGCREGSRAGSGPGRAVGPESGRGDPRAGSPVARPAPAADRRRPRPMTPCPAHAVAHHLFGANARSRPAVSSSRAISSLIHSMSAAKPRLSGSCPR